MGSHFLLLLPYGSSFLTKHPFVGAFLVYAIKLCLFLLGKVTVIEFALFAGAELALAFVAGLLGYCLRYLVACRRSFFVPHTQPAVTFLSCCALFGYVLVAILNEIYGGTLLTFFIVLMAYMVITLITATGFSKEEYVSPCCKGGRNYTVIIAWVVGHCILSAFICLFELWPIVSGMWCSIIALGCLCLFTALVATLTWFRDSDNNKKNKY